MLRGECATIRNASCGQIIHLNVVSRHLVSSSSPHLRHGYNCMSQARTWVADAASGCSWRSLASATRHTTATCTSAGARIPLFSYGTQSICTRSTDKVYTASFPYELWADRVAMADPCVWMMIHSMTVECVARSRWLTTLITPKPCASHHGYQVSNSSLVS